MYDGILLINKEKGYTSHDVVAKLRGITGQKKIGHTGTLDPDATGVLPVCLGRATKLCGLLTGNDKIYETTLLLGKTTDTQDITGRILLEKDTSLLTEDGIREAILSFKGSYMQIPPMYSAIKVGGKKLYELARTGIEVPRKAKNVSVNDIRILDMASPRVRMEISCSKGTYIRTLCHDIGEKLGCGGCMESLTRTKSGSFMLKDCYTLSEVREYALAGRLSGIIIPPDDLFGGYAAVTVKDEFKKNVYNGNPVLQVALDTCADWNDGQLIRVYDSDKRFVALYRYGQDEDCFRVEFMFYGG